MGSAFDGGDQTAAVKSLFANAGIPDGEAADTVVNVETLAFASGASFGAGLKAAREFLGLSLQDVADATKIRGQYLASLEAMDLAQLPSRPFTLGYVRAYARVLGLDEDKAIAHFRMDAPDPNEPLRAPVGVPKVGDPRLGFLFTGAALVVAAIVAWNIVQHVMAKHSPLPKDELPIVATVPDAQTAPVQLGEALPVPVESTIPDPYVTPGLSGVTGVPEAPVNTGPLKPATEARRFATRSAIFGAPAEQSQLLIQAQRSVSLVARGGDGKVYFAQQLGAGEAYRVPMLSGLLIDVSSPEAMEVYVGGMLAGTLAHPVTPLSSLPKAAPPVVTPVQPAALPQG